MMTLLLGLPIALSDGKDWTPARRLTAIAWLIAIDMLILLTV